jgi:hypothetical protein
MSKKLYSDAVFLATAAAIDALNKQAEDMAQRFNLPITDLLQTNLPAYNYTDEETAEIIPVSPIALDEANRLALYEPEKAGTLALVTLYGTATQPAEGTNEPLTIPTAVYLVNLPTLKEIKSDTALSEYMETLLTRDLLARARRIAKDHAKDPARAMQTNRISALMSAATRGSNAAEKSFLLMFQTIQAAILRQASAVIERHKAAKNMGAAKLVAATYSAQRLSRQTLKECFSSRVAAEHHFPQMPQTQWESLLKFCIATAPSCPIREPSRGEDGKILKGPDGKSLSTVTRKALSAEFFHTCLATRDERLTTTAEAEALTFEGLTA